MKRILFIFLLLPTILLSESPKIKNKLLSMYRLFYLPFEIYFEEGSEPNEIVPILNLSSNKFKMLHPNEMRSIDADWKKLRLNLRKKSLLIPQINKISLSGEIFSTVWLHHRDVNLKTITAQTLIPDLLKSFKIKNAENSQNKDHFFLLAPSWCASSEEYALVLENYFKENQKKEAIFHFVVIKDPDKKIFYKPIFKGLFPNEKKYSHLNFPRFLFFQSEKNKILEEAEAIDFFLEKNSHLLGKYNVQSEVLKKVFESVKK